MSKPLKHPAPSSGANSGQRWQPHGVNTPARQSQCVLTWANPAGREKRNFRSLLAGNAHRVLARSGLRKRFFAPRRLGVSA